MKIKFRPNLQGRKLYFSRLSQEWNDYLHPLWNANILNCLKICSIKEIAFIAFIMSDIWWINSFRSIATCPYICSCVNGWFIISFLFLSVIFQWGNDSWKSLLRLVSVGDYVRRNILGCQRSEERRVGKECSSPV